MTLTADLPALCADLPPSPPAMSVPFGEPTNREMVQAVRDFREREIQPITAAPANRRAAGIREAQRQLLRLQARGDADGFDTCRLLAQRRQNVEDHLLDAQFIPAHMRQAGVDIQVDIDIPALLLAEDADGLLQDEAEIDIAFIEREQPGLGFRDGLDILEHDDELARLLMH